MIKKKLARIAGFFLFLIIFAIELFGIKNITLGLSV